VQELGGSGTRQVAQAGQGNIPHHRCHAQFINWSQPGGQESFYFYSIFHEFKSSLGWEFKFFWEAGLLREFCKICKICNFQILRLLGDWLQTDHRVVRKTALYILSFAYSLLSLLLSLLVAVLLVVLVFPLLFYLTVFISTHEFYLLSISPPHDARGQGEG